MSKSRLSALLTGEERWNADHLYAFAEILEVETWQLTDWNPLESQHHGLSTLRDAIIRIPDPEERERAVRAAQRMLESYAEPIADPPPDAKKKRA